MRKFLTHIVRILFDFRSRFYLPYVSGRRAFCDKSDARFAPSYGNSEFPFLRVAFISALASQGCFLLLPVFFCHHHHFRYSA